MRRGIPVALTAEEADRALERELAAARADLRELTAGFSAEDREEAVQEELARWLLRVRTCRRCGRWYVRASAASPSRARSVTTAGAPAGGRAAGPGRARVRGQLGAVRAGARARPCTHGVDEAELTAVDLHDARHTCASVMIAAGVNVKALSEFMGHASITITLDRYGHLLPGALDEAAALLDAYLAGLASATAARAGPRTERMTGTWTGT